MTELRAGKRVARNVGWNFGSQLWLVVLGLLVTPFVVHRLHVDVYGLYTLLLAFAAYFGMLDLGFGYATTKYVSEYHGRGDHAAVQRIISTSLATYAVLGVLGGGALALVSPLLVQHVLSVPEHLRPLAQSAFLVAALAFAANMMLSALTAIPNALQRMELTMRRTIAFGTVGSAGTVVLLALGRGLISIVALQAVVNAGAAVSFVRLSKRLLPDVSFRPRFDRATFRLLARFSVLKFANNVATNTVMQIDKVLVGALLTLSAVGYYMVPLQLAQRLTNAVGAVSVAFLPAASAFHGRDERARFEELYLRATKVVAILGLPLASMLVVFAHPILQYWVSATFAARGTTALQVLAVGYGLNIFSTIPAIASDSVGRPGVTTSFSVASAALNVSLSVVLIPRFGIAGAAAAIAINSIVLVPYFVYYVHRKVLGIPLRRVLRESLAAPAAAVALSWIAMVLLRQTVHGLPSLALALALSLAVFLGLTPLVRVYDATDRQLARAYFARG